MSNLVTSIVSGDRYGLVLLPEVVGSELSVPTETATKTEIRVFPSVSGKLFPVPSSKDLVDGVLEVFLGIFEERVVKELPSSGNW